MTKRLPAKLRRSAVGGLAALILVGGTGCQTFSLTEEEFEKQQRGEMVDPEVGTAVGLAGSVAYCGMVIGALVAEICGK